MRPRKTLSLLVGLCWLTLSGCAGSNPLQLLIPKTQLVYPVVNLDLTCPDEPLLPPVLVTDVDYGKWSDEVKKAGAICRGRLKAVRDWTDKWPKEMK